MKKVGIMTWYQHMNYGTFLQAAALQTIIKELGYEVEGINYVSHIGHTRKTILEKIVSPRFMKNKVKNLFLNIFSLAIDLYKIKLPNTTRNINGNSPNISKNLPYKLFV